MSREKTAVFKSLKVSTEVLMRYVISSYALFNAHYFKQPSP